MKKILLIVVAFIVVAGGSFYGGTKYAQSQTPQKTGAAGTAFRNGRTMATGTAGIGRTNGGAAANFANGDIIAKDDKSITVKLQTGRSRLLFRRPLNH